MKKIFGLRKMIDEILVRGPNAEPLGEMAIDLRIEQEMATSVLEEDQEYYIWNGTSIRSLIRICTCYPNLETRHQAWTLLEGYRGWVDQLTV